MPPAIFIDSNPAQAAEGQQQPSRVRTFMPLWRRNQEENEDGYGL
jgi:hypothetical protein